MTQPLIDTNYIAELLKNPAIPKKKKAQLQELANWVSTANRPGSIIQRTANDKALLNFTKNFIKKSCEITKDPKASIDLFVDMMEYALTKLAEDEVNNFLTENSQKSEKNNKPIESNLPKDINPEEPKETRLEFNNSPPGLRFNKPKYTKQNLLRTDGLQDKIDGVQKKAGFTDNSIFPWLAGGATGAGATLLIANLLKDMKNNKAKKQQAEFLKQLQQHGDFYAY